MGLYLKSFHLIFPTIKKNKLLSFGVVFLHLLIIGLFLCHSYWSKYFYDALLTYDKKLILNLFFIFILIASLFIIASGFKSYLEKFLEFKIRENLYEKYSKIWHLNNITNPEQRIHEDIIGLAKGMIPFIEILIKSTLEFPIYLFIIISSTSVYILILILLYVAISTYLSARIAKPLVLLENIQQKREAEFRKDLTYKMDPESGHPKNEMPSLQYIKENWIELAKKTKNLNFYTSGYSQISIFFQLLIFLPSYLLKQISIGQFMQNIRAMQTLTDSLSVFINSRQIMVDIRVITIRLTEMEAKKN